MSDAARDATRETINRPRLPTEPTALLVRMARDEAERFLAMSKWEDRHPTDRVADEFRWSLMHGLADRLETMEAAISALIAAWPDHENNGPVLFANMAGQFWLCTRSGEVWPDYNGPYETREAAVMAHLASVKEGEPTT